MRGIQTEEGGDDVSYSNALIESKLNAGRAAAHEDFARGRLAPPLDGEVTPWGAGYRLGIEDLAERHGRRAVREAGAES